MKRYIDYLYEISSDELYEGLLGYGLFSDKLPPLFSSVNFFEYCYANAVSFQSAWHSWIHYDSMRNTNVPRQIGIPNPMAYQQLCKCLSDNWINILSHFQTKTQNQSHTISRIHLRKMAETKALFKMNYSNWKIDGTPTPDLLIGSKYIVRADISTCFPSIYTHSIPWALVGKDTAKAHAGKRYCSLWYNQLDKCAQICKNGETHGLHIGPHASNLIGEIVLTCIDCELEKSWKYIRNIDDYTCYVETKEDAKLFLLDLSAELRKFDLSLNHKKTQIAELPTAMTEQWERQIGSTYTYMKNGIMDYLGVRAFLDNAIEVMQRNGENSAILNYAIKSLPEGKLSPNAKEYCVKTILHLCLLYPYLLQILDEWVFLRFNVPEETIKEYSERIYEQEIRNKNYDGVCYALFYALKYGFIMKSDLVKAQDAIDSDSCIFRLLAFLYFKKHMIVEERKKLRDYADKLKNDDFDQNWLFAYEVLPHSNLAGEWKKLKASGVSFLKKEYQV